MTMTIIVGNTYHVNLEDLRDIDLRGRACIESRIDNIRGFLNAFIDDVMVHHDYLKTNVTCHYDYTSFIISIEESYPFVKRSKRPILFKFDCEIKEMTNTIMANIIENCVIDNGDLSNHQTGLAHKFLDITTAPSFFKAIKVIDGTLAYDDEISHHIHQHLFNPNYKNILTTSIFDIVCGGEIVLQVQFDLGPFHFSIYGEHINVTCGNKSFSFEVSSNHIDDDIDCLQSIFKLFYRHSSGEIVDYDYKDFITLFKMKYI